jgi:hypothetical protein
VTNLSKLTLTGSTISNVSNQTGVQRFLDVDGKFEVDITGCTIADRVILAGPFIKLQNNAVLNIKTASTISGKQILFIS